MGRGDKGCGMDVIVLGAGLMGAATAFFLARRGANVTLIERGPVGAGATVASFGNIRRSGRHLAQLPLAARSLALWEQAEALLGRDVEFRATGHLRLIFDAEGLAQMHAYAAQAAPFGLGLEELGANDLRARFPGLGQGAIGASLSPRDGSANPRLVGPAFAAAAARLGARVVDHAGAVSVARSASGFDVTTAQGVFGAGAVVNCTGWHGAALAAQFGEPVPLVPYGPLMGVTEPLPHRIAPVVGEWGAAHGAYLRQVERGNVVFGGAVDRVAVDPATGFARPDPLLLPAQLRAVLRLCPALADVAVIRQWSGAEGYVADMLPVLGPSGTTPGLFHAFGFCGHGFQLGPGVGDALAELVTTGACETPLEAMHIGRFA
jgi:sarcosine oxidase, subunit beta